MVFKIRTLVLPEPRTQEDLLLILGGPLKKFTWRELKAATNNFSNKNIVGRGGFGKVYKGILWDGSVVAVKRLKEERTEGGELQFQTEVEIGNSQASGHRNVLQLRGYCMTRKERVLVYPFMENTSVASRLRERQPSEPPLDWATRKRIALGSAKGLAYFHSGCSSFIVIHRDIKAANILLDDQFEAILSDFGLAKFVDRNSNEELPNSGWVQRPMEEENEDPFEEEEESEDEDRYGFTVSCWNFTKTLMIKSDYVDEAREGTKRSCWQVTKNEVISISGGDHRSGGTVGPPNIHDSRGWSEAQAQPNYDFTHVTTAVRGTIGHIAPEYLSTGKCSVKSDVFGYGIMLLELITGQRSFDLARLANDDDVLLLDWVEGLMRDNKLNVVVDSDLGTDYVIEEIEQLTQISLSCTRSSPLDRPLMSEVIKMIENIGQRPSHDQLLGGENVVKRFSLHQLKLATDNFNKKNIMGRSGFSNVYRGRLQEDGSIVVVKRLVSKSKRGRQQFRAEVKLGSMITNSHPNLLQLRGYYSSGKEMLLVYPFMAHRSLEWSLRPERSLRLGWRVRIRIALGTAKGIAYLHNDCDLNTIIRRDVKPSNILLDDDFNPVLSNLRLQSNDSSQVDNNEDSNPDLTDIEGSNQNGYQVSSAICLVKNDVYAFGTTLFVLISGKKVADLNVMAANDHDNSYTNGSNVHNWFKNKLRHHQLRLLVDPSIVLGDNNYDTMYINDEIEQIVQVALLCTQPSPMDRPEISEVIQMLEGISQGDLKICFAFDCANLFQFNSNPLECPQAELQQEVELGAMLDLPSLDTEGSVRAELGHINQVQLKSTDEVMPKSEPHLNMPSISMQDTSFTSKGKEVASSSVKPACNKRHDDQQTRYRSQSKGISISDNKWEPKMHERWKVFLSEVVSGALPTKSKLCQSGMSVDPLCPFCNEYEEDNFHLFFNCDFSKQAWQLVMGVRIDMLGFESVKEAVDVILMPDARVNIPSGLEPSHFSDKGVAVMYSIWNHRNKVCFEKVPPNVKEVVSLSQNHCAVPIGSSQSHYA